MVRSGYWLGKLREVYVGIYQDILYEKQRREKIHSAKVIKFLTINGYLIFGSKIVKVNKEMNDKEATLAKKVALITCSNTIRIKRGGVEVSRMYRFLNWRKVCKYVIIPIALIAGLSIYLIL